MFAILCNSARAGSYQLGELSALLAAWQVTEAWLPGDVGLSQRLRSTQARLTSCIRCCLLPLTAVLSDWRSAAACSVDSMIVSCGACPEDMHSIVSAAVRVEWICSSGWGPRLLTTQH